MFVSTVITSPYNYEWCCGDDGYCSMWGRTEHRFADWRGKKVKYGWPLCLHWNRVNNHVSKTKDYLEAMENQEKALAFFMGMHPRLGQNSLMRGLDPALFTVCGKLISSKYPTW